jgi:hypothetical protein
VSLLHKAGVPHSRKRRSWSPQAVKCPCGTFSMRRRRYCCKVVDIPMAFSSPSRVRPRPYCRPGESAGAGSGPRLRQPMATGPEPLRPAKMRSRPGRSLRYRPNLRLSGSRRNAQLKAPGHWLVALTANVLDAAEGWLTGAAEAHPPRCGHRGDVTVQTPGWAGSKSAWRRFLLSDCERTLGSRQGQASLTPGAPAPRCWCPHRSGVAPD